MQEQQRYLKKIHTKINLKLFKKINFPGVILTLPEYRLSFQLKIYELVEKGETRIACEFLNAHKWLNQNVRSILDECDAILDAKYQLVYTVGTQQRIDGGPHRWKVIQALLKRIPFHMKRLYLCQDKEKIEFNIDYVKNGHVFGAPMVDYRDDVFTPCRILDHSMFKLLKDALIDDFLDSKIDIAFPEMVTSAKSHLRSILGNRTVDPLVSQSVFDSIDQRDRNTVLIFSGLLRFEVLKLILTKRWRVNYGVNEKGTRKMAIPFKAKDVAAEMTEFGHSDVAICFTYLSYYYSGAIQFSLFFHHQISVEFVFNLCPYFSPRSF